MLQRTILTISKEFKNITTDEKYFFHENDTIIIKTENFKLCLPNTFLENLYYYYFFSTAECVHTWFETFIIRQQSNAYLHMRLLSK